MFSLTNTRRTYLSGCVFFIMCGLVFLLNTLSQYRIDQHKKFYTFLDLPDRNAAFLKTRRVDYDGWTPGSSKWLVDLTELQTKIPKNITMTGHHEIVYYSRMPDYILIKVNAKLETCPYTNCHISNHDGSLQEASAVIFEVSGFKIGPPPRTRPAGQVWIFSDLEPPIINGMWDHRRRSWDGKFNWTLSYRFDSDIIRPYGALRTRAPNEIPHTNYHEMFHRKSKFAAWIVSNCHSTCFRDEYVKELQKYIPIDIYGKCGNLTTNYTAESMQAVLKDYKFYIGFENSFCVDYMTEKFVHYFRLSDAIVILRGGADYDQLLPEYTHINAQHFMNAKDLATYLLWLNRSESEYTKFLETRDKFEVSHLYEVPNKNLASYSINWACNMCIKLNNKESYTKVYNDIVGWWHTNKCWKPTDFVTEWHFRQYGTILLMLITSTVITVYIVLKLWYRNKATSS